jgi:hypothetical protein
LCPPRFGDEVELQYYRLQLIYASPIDLKQGDAQGVKSPSEVGTAEVKGEKAPLSKIIEVLTGLGADIVMESFHSNPQGNSGFESERRARSWKDLGRMGQPAIMKGILNRSAHLLFALGAGKRLGHHFANQHLTGLAGMNVASELVRRGKRAIQQAEGARVSSASR